jgi:hypothetical protein
MVAFLGSPIGALVVLKTAFDLGLHLRERGRADSAWQPACSSAASTPATAPPGPANR